MEYLLNGIETDRSLQDLHKSKDLKNVEYKDANDIYDEKSISIVLESEVEPIDPDIVDAITIDIIAP